jgi:DNA adenine methylase
MFFYHDPTYYETGGYGVPFEFGQYERTAVVLEELQGREPPQDFLGRFNVPS